MMVKKVILGIRLCGKLCVNFHSVAVTDTSYTIRLLAKFEFPVRTSNKTCVNTLWEVW